MNQIKVIAFDADDTLWVNEPYYQDAEKVFCNLLEEFMPQDKTSAELFKTEIANIDKYGYGAKSFTLSLIETAIRISNKKVSAETIEKILDLGKSLLQTPVELLDDIEFLLNNLKSKYRLAVATKGDPIDQHRKLISSGLLPHFHHIEIMQEKNETEYQKLITRLNINPEEFLMIGNSLKSDVLPVLAMGGRAVHIPFHTTWQHEHADNKIAAGQYHEITKLTELLTILK
ncbi:MAG: HAD family hydrolase [Bacteroidota bacterium]